MSKKNNKIIKGKSALEILDEVNNPDKIKPNIDFFKKAISNAKKYNDRKK